MDKYFNFLLIFKLFFFLSAHKIIYAQIIICEVILPTKSFNRQTIFSSDSFSLLVPAVRSIFSCYNPARVAAQQFYAFRFYFLIFLRNSTGINP